MDAIMRGICGSGSKVKETLHVQNDFFCIIDSDKSPDVNIRSNDIDKDMGFIEFQTYDNEISSS